MAHSGDRQRLPVRLDAACIHKSQKAIQQTSIIQPLDRINTLPAVQGLRHGLIVALRKLPIQQFAQIRVDFRGSLALLTHRCLRLALG